MVVDHLDNLEDVVPILKQLGGRHGTQGYNIPQEYFPYLGRAMNDKMESTVSTFNKTTENAWNELYSWVTDQITAGQKEYTADQAK
ncbi:flavohemoprotein-like [Liolophura sinensis]|uniref:flavohemoprotein-like n=1 Tax=Liolophura sinensis TaxID=3198878 RepID=UPI0031585568